MRKLASLCLCLAVAASLLAGCSKKTETTASNSAEGTASRASAGPAGAVRAGDPGRGKTIFANNCAMCHGATGTEGGVGPSLKNEKSRKDLAATVAWIKNPEPPMPKLYPATLTEKDVADVAAFVQTL